MGYTLEEFYQDTRKALQAQAGPAGREVVRQNLERLLKNEAVITLICGPEATPGIEVIHRCPDTGFNVLVHVYERGKSGPPHDHGNSWAVYGQAVGHTVMTKWKRLDDGSQKGHANVEKAGSFRIDPGMAGKFEPGEIHSIEIADGSRFVRVTGTDLNAIETLVFNPKEGLVAAGSRL